MLKWDKDSPVTFHPDGHTVYDFDRRFALEEEGFIVPGETFPLEDVGRTVEYETILKPREI